MTLEEQDSFARDLGSVPAAPIASPGRTLTTCPTMEKALTTITNGRSTFSVEWLEATASAWSAEHGVDLGAEDVARMFAIAYLKQAIRPSATRTESLDAYTKALEAIGAAANVRGMR